MGTVLRSFGGMKRAMMKRMPGSRRGVNRAEEIDLCLYMPLTSFTHLSALLRIQTKIICSGDSEIVCSSIKLLLFVFFSHIPFSKIVLTNAISLGNRESKKRLVLSRGIQNNLTSISRRFQDLNPAHKARIFLQPLSMD